MARVLLKHISKRYDGDVLAVNDFNLEIRDTEFVVLVGPSGCGKTTTLRMVAGLEEITEGELWIGDRVVNRVHPKDRDIAMVFQNYALYPHMTVFENMAFGLRLRKIPKAEITQRVDNAAKILDITTLLARKPKALSGGQRQRVAMGRAIVRDPQVFLFDEPLSNLDAKLRVQMRAEISKLHQRLKRTILYVTHDQVEAMTLADRIVVMDAGVLQQVGTPMEVFNQPANTFVAGFIGSPSMNFLDGEVVDEAGTLLLRGEGFSLRLAPELRGMLGEDRAMRAGFRPQYMAVADAHTPAEVRPHLLRTTIEFIEHMGAEKFIHTRLASGETITTRAEGTLAVEPGDTLELAVPPERVQLFNAQGLNVRFAQP